MAGGVRLNPWAALAASFATLAAVAWGLPREALDWQPALVASQPWRALSAAFVHWSALHLAANLAGTLVVAAFGLAARVPAAAALAWLAAWPLTHLGLLLRPDLVHYGGLSGVLHAGVAVAACGLLFDADRRRGWLGFAVLAGLAAKLVVEAPWGPALQQAPGWDISLAPFAHATGTVAGLLCALFARGVRSLTLRSAA